MSKTFTSFEGSELLTFAFIFMSGSSVSVPLEGSSNSARRYLLDISLIDISLNITLKRNKINYQSFEFFMSTI